jgi:hypothetical protein
MEGLSDGLEETLGDTLGDALGEILGETLGLLDGEMLGDTDALGTIVEVISSHPDAPPTFIFPVSRL